MSASAASDSAVGGLAIGYMAAGGGPQTYLGPGLMQGMSEAQAFERLNAWGIARDGELVDLKSNLTNLQSVVGATFAEARTTLMQIVVDFRGEAETLRQHSLYEANQGLARLEQVVTDARSRFDAQDARHTQDLGELARRISAAPAAQPQAMTFQAAPAPARLGTSWPAVAPLVLPRCAAPARPGLACGARPGRQTSSGHR